MVRSLRLAQDWILMNMLTDLQNLLRLMICPDPAYRITAMQAYHHPALLPTAPTVIITPHFVRAAASFDYSEETMPPPAKVEDGEKNKRKSRNQKKTAKEQPRASTPTALGESIKQHTSVSKPKAEKRDGVKGMKGEMTPSPRKERLVIRKSSDVLLVDGERDGEDPARKLWVDS